MLSRADYQVSTPLLPHDRQTHLNTSHSFGGAKTHSVRGHKRPVHISDIQDQTFLFLVLLVKKEDSEKIFRSALWTRPKKTNLQQTCKELHSVCTISLDHWVPVRSRGGCMFSNSALLLVML